MKEQAVLDINKRNVLLQKIQGDLSYGVKILGNYSNPRDTIRVWTRLGQSIFIIVATSPKNFDIEFDTLEIQSFTDSGGYKLAILSDNSAGFGYRISIDAWKLDKNFLATPITDKDDKGLLDFINDYLQSTTTHAFVKEMFEKNYYNKEKYEWVTPGVI